MHFMNDLGKVACLLHISLPFALRHNEAVRITRCLSCCVGNRFLQREAPERIGKAIPCDRVESAAVLWSCRVRCVRRSVFPVLHSRRE